MILLYFLVQKNIKKSLRICLCQHKYCQEYLSDYCKFWSSANGILMLL